MALVQMHASLAKVIIFVLVKGMQKYWRFVQFVPKIVPSLPKAPSMSP